MGFNTAAIIRNDYLHEIGSDTEIGQKIRSLVLSNGRDQDYGYISGITVLPSEHADYDQLVVIGQNRIRPFRELSKDERTKMVRGLADLLGYNLRKKAPRRTQEG